MAHGVLKDRRALPGGPYSHHSVNNENKDSKWISNCSSLSCFEESNLSVQMKEAYFEIVLLLLVREMSTYHHPKTKPRSVRKFEKVQLCTISECGATQTTKGICIQRTKLTLFLLFPFVGLIRLGNQTPFVWSILKAIFLLCVASRTCNKHEVVQNYSTWCWEENKSLLSLKGYYVPFDHFSLFFFANVK